MQRENRIVNEKQDFFENSVSSTMIQIFLAYQIKIHQNVRIKYKILRDLSMATALLLQKKKRKKEDFSRKCTTVN